MKNLYKKPEAELIVFKAMENIMEQDGNPSITDGDEDWPEENGE